jgi:hypothetical protein
MFAQLNSFLGTCNINLLVLHCKRFVYVQFYIRWKSILLWIDNAREQLNNPPDLTVDNFAKIHDETKVG